MNLNRLFTYVSLFIILVSLSSCAERSQMPGKAFEGTITEIIRVPGIGDILAKSDSGQAGASMGASAISAVANVGLKMYVRENKVAYDISMLGGLINMHTIIDRNMRTMTTLLPNHTAVVVNLRSLDSMRGRIDDSIRSRNSLLDSLQAIIPQATGKHETIHDLDAEQYIGKRGPVETELWLTSNDKIKAFDIVRDAFLGRASAGMGGIDEVFGMLRPIAGKIPVRFETKINGKVFANGELTDIKEEQLDDALFEIPKDYQVVNGDSLRTARRQEHHNVTAP